MSKRNAEKFIEEVRCNGELQEKLTKMGDAYQGDRKDLASAVRQNILPVAKEMNLPFTVEEYVECVKGQSQNRELTEEELNQVVGGVGNVDMSGSETGRDVTIVDQHVEYHETKNYFFIMPGADEDTLRALFG